MIKVNNELALFDKTLSQKPQIVVLSKIDLPEVQEKLEIIKNELSDAGIKAHYLSAETGQGVKELMGAALEVLQIQVAKEKAPEPPAKVFRPQPKEGRIKVTKQGGEWVIQAAGLDRLIAGSGFTADDLRWQLNHQLEKHGVNGILERAGVKAGDKVRCGDLVWEWDKPGRSANKIGIFGGTFDPVHLGHLMVVEEAKTALDLSEVLLVPAGQPVSRPNVNVTPAKQRLAMLNLAVEDNPYLKVSTIEIERKGPSYTSDTIAEIKKKSGRGNELYFILGWDSLEQLPTWHEPSKIIGLCTLVAVPRPGYAKPSLKSLEGVLPGISDKVIFLDKPRVDISATEIRELAAQGESIDHLVSEKVAQYIKKNKLYQSS
jgi:nicotinate-nucleotide adenylyltransferase